MVKVVVLSLLSRRSLNLTINSNCNCRDELISVSHHSNHSLQPLLPPQECTYCSDISPLIGSGNLVMTTTIAKFFNIFLIESNYSQKYVER